VNDDDNYSKRSPDNSRESNEGNFITETSFGAREANDFNQTSTFQQRELLSNEIINKLSIMDSAQAPSELIKQIERSKPKIQKIKLKKNSVGNSFANSIYSA